MYNVSRIKLDVENASRQEIITFKSVIKWRNNTTLSKQFQNSTEKNVEMRQTRYP